MWPLVLGLVGIGTGVYLFKRHYEAGPVKTGEVYAIGLFGVPERASVEETGIALAQALGWGSVDMVLDGAISRTAQGQVLTIAFKGNARTPPLPSTGFRFKVNDADVVVTFVVLQPARTSAFP